MICETMSVKCLVLCFARSRSSGTMFLPLLVLSLLGFAVHNTDVPFPASLRLLFLHTHALLPGPPGTSGGRHTVSWSGVAMARGSCLVPWSVAACLPAQGD